MGPSDSPRVVCIWVLSFDGNKSHVYEVSYSYSVQTVVITYYRVAKTHRILYLYRSFSAKEPYI